MCSIVASFDRDKLVELAKQNAHRGCVSHSFTVIHPGTNKVVYWDKCGGALKYDAIPEFDGNYAIIHQQAPTTGVSADNIHPAVLDEFESRSPRMLWHNGIIKAKALKCLQNKLESNSTWDTYILLEYLERFAVPHDIDGSFACLWYTAAGTLWAFRNEISPLFIDDDLTISSTKFNGSHYLEPNKMFIILLGARMLGEIETGRFVTVDNPYYFGT